MINPKEWLEFGQKFHGHKCPAMPNGLRVAAAAMNKLGVERTGDSDLHVILELGEHHCAHCFTDGVQVITGCTMGKENIESIPMGKWGLTLIDKKTNRAVRVAPTAESMMASKNTEFFTKYRMKGVAPTQVPDEVVEPLIDKVMNTPDEDMLIISEIFDYDWKEPKGTFAGFICEECGEMVVEKYGRIVGDKKLCIACANK